MTIHHGAGAMMFLFLSGAIGYFALRMARTWDADDHQ
jgi:hypothetical protein